MRLSLIAALTLLTPCQASSQILFHEEWEDANGAARWSAPIVASETGSFDGAVDYAFDYSTLGAPSAPNTFGGATLGLFLRANVTDQRFVDQGEAVGVTPLDFTLPDTDFRLTADNYLHVAGTPGTTEYATLGVHHGGSANVPNRFGLNQGDGVAWQANSDGLPSDDLLRFESAGGVEASLGGYEAIADGSIPGVPTGAASPLGPKNQWIELSITSVAGAVEFAMNGYVFDTFDNATGVYTAGTLLLGVSDPFSSVNNGDPSNGVVFDNVIVTSITPPIVGDFDGDGDVDGGDFGVFVSGFQNSPQGGPPYASGDFDEDGDVDGGDFGAFVDGFQNFPPDASRGGSRAREKRLGAARRVVRHAAVTTGALRPRSRTLLARRAWRIRASKRDTPRAPHAAPCRRRAPLSTARRIGTSGRRA